MVAMNYLDQETDILSNPDCKIVVFTGYNATLLQFYELFNARFRPLGIYIVAQLSRQKSKIFIMN